jgi:hypothetical protein
LRLDAPDHRGQRARVAFALDLHTSLTWGVLALSIPTWLALRSTSAPYGRHARTGWGPTVPARIAWIAMESPACFAWLGFFFSGQHALEPAPLVLLGLWQLHYVRRAFLLPLRTHDDGKRVPALVPLLAIGFNLANAYINARQVSAVGRYGVDWLLDPRFVLGSLVFLYGRHVNVRSDDALVALRNEGKGYQIPRGGWFERISCPNYAGEILEWFGWALATWSLPGLAFALYTLANLAPRAVSHHRWYRERFPDYPPERRALLPRLLR